MGGGFDGAPGPGKRSPVAEELPEVGPAAGKRTLVEGIAPWSPAPHLTRLLVDGPDGGPPVQRKPADAGSSDLGATAQTPIHGAAVQRIAAQGVASAGSSLPHGTTIERLFGRHDVSSIEAHVGADAALASRAIGAEAYATGHHVAFARAPSLHTAAHEAAHVIQQRGGVQLKGGVGDSGNAHEQHADAVADAVVSGRSAEALLDRYANGAGEGTAVQRQVAPVDAGVVPAGVGPDPLSADPAAMQDAELGSAYDRAKSSGDSSRAQALDAEMDRRWGLGAATPRGPQPVTRGNSAVAKDVALSLLDNMAEGKPPFKPAEGIGGCSWFTTEGNPYTSVSVDKNINVAVEIAKGNAPLVFREADLGQDLR
jgi:hypothetical protein